MWTRFLKILSMPTLTSKGKNGMKMSDFRGIFGSVALRCCVAVKTSLRMVKETCNLPRRLLGRPPYATKPNLP